MLDVNGTRFRLLLGEGDFARLPGVGSELEWDARHNEVTLTPVPFDPPVDSLAAPLTAADRRGAASDTFGNWYWIAPDTRSVLVRSSGSNDDSTFWPDPGCKGATGGTGGAGGSGAFGGFSDATAAAPELGAPLAGVAVTEDHFLVVGRVDPAGLLVFDLTSGGAPSPLPWPAAVPFVPFDIAPRHGGGVFVLDREGCRVWELDRRFHVLPAVSPAESAPAAGSFAPTVPASPGSPPAGATGRPVFDLSAATVVPAGTLSVETGPIATDAAGNEIPTTPGVPQPFLTLGDDTASGSSVGCFRAGAALGASGAIPSGVSGHDLALTVQAAPIAQTAFVATVLGDRAYGFTVTFDGTVLTFERLPGFYPMRGFAGRALVARGAIAYYDYGELWIPLTEQRRPQYDASGTLESPVLDGVEPGCVWHRLLIDAIVPPGTSLAVAMRAGDDASALSVLDYVPEPTPQPRATGVELPFVDLGPYATHELLFQRARGRYLQLQLTLAGNGRATPRVRALRAWYPRFSYVERYLPGVYRQDSASASFLDRYLSNLEGFYTTTEDLIAAAQVLLGASTAPAADLAWLASFYDLALDPMWDERRTRLLLSNAAAFFQARGTIRGVSLALRLVLEPCIDASAFAIPQPPALSAPRIVEAYRTRSTPGVVFGDPTDQAAPRVVVPSPKWTPDQGRDVLNAGWLQYVKQQGLTAAWTQVPDPLTFPIADPGGVLSSPWSGFAQAVLGFVPVDVSLPANAPLWSAFLSRRYPGIGALAAAYGLPGAQAPAGFDTVLPASLPADGHPLLDWFQFESVVLPMRAKAHQFTVLLPWPLSVTDSQRATLDQTQLRDLATRVVTLQKPAQTVFQVKFFWAAFRIGDARLGDDTLLGSSSRVPELVSETVLGRNYVGETWLAGAPATDTIDRSASLRALRDTGEESQ